MKRIIAILVLVITLIASTVTANATANAGYSEIGVPAIKAPLTISVENSTGLWNPGDPLNDLWITIDPYGGTLIELFYDDGFCFFVVYYNPAQIYYEPNGAFVNGISSNIRQLEPNIYEVSVPCTQPTYVNISLEGNFTGPVHLDFIFVSTTNNYQEIHEVYADFNQSITIQLDNCNGPMDMYVQEYPSEQYFEVISSPIYLTTIEPGQNRIVLKVPFFGENLNTQAELFFKRFLLAFRQLFDYLCQMFKR